MNSLKEVITELRATQAVVKALIKHKVVDQSTFENVVIDQLREDSRDLSPLEAEQVRDAAKEITIY